MKKIIVLIFSSLLILSACSNNKDITNLDVVLDYTPNTNHTGLYVAQEKNYFKENSLNVNIMQLNNNSAEQLVASNKAQFGISYSENVAQFNDTNEDKITSIYTILDENTSGFVSESNKNINSVKDFKGKTYCGWGSDVENAILKTTLEKEGLSFNDINVVTTSSDFVNAPDECDFMWVYEGWDIVKLDQDKIDYNFIRFNDLNIKWYTPVIITNDKVDKGIVTNFIDSIRKGYNYSKDNSEDSANIFLKYNPEYDKDFILNSQKFLSAHYTTNGYQDPLVWDNFTKFLKDNNIVSKDLPTESLYTNDYSK